MATLGNNLQYWRKHRSLSQEQVAIALQREGVDRDRVSVSNYEQGVRKPSIDTLKALARIYRCSLQDLIPDSDMSLVDLPSDPATKGDIDRILAAILELREQLARGVIEWAESELRREINNDRRRSLSEIAKT